jgi:hypothetical protein
MVPLKREKGIAAAVIGIATAAILSPEANARDQLPDSPSAAVSGAHTTCYGSTYTHCFALGQSNLLIADGGAARFNFLSYSAPDWNHGGNLCPNPPFYGQCWGHTNQTLWVSVKSDPGQWCEVGWSKGFKGQPEAYHYWGFNVFEDGEWKTDEFGIYVALGDYGTSHFYQISRQYDGLYNIYIDNNDVADCFVDPFTVDIDVGLEYTAPNAVAPVNEPREIQFRDTNLNWHYMGELGTTMTENEVGSASRWDWVTQPTHGKDWTTN